MHALFFHQFHQFAIMSPKRSQNQVVAGNSNDSRFSVFDASCPSISSMAPSIHLACKCNARICVAKVEQRCIDTEHVFGDKNDCWIPVGALNPSCFFQTKKDCWIVFQICFSPKQILTKLCSCCGSYYSDKILLAKYKTSPKFHHRSLKHNIYQVVRRRRDRLGKVASTSSCWSWSLERSCSSGTWGSSPSRRARSIISRSSPSSSSSPSGEGSRSTCGLSIRWLRSVPVPPRPRNPRQNPPL